MKGITFYTAHDISSAYSCLLYLKKELEKSRKITIWSRTSASNCEKENFSNQNIHSFYNEWYGKIPKLRVVLIHIFTFFKMLFSDNHILINDLDFFIQAYYVKKIHPNKKVILYCTEIYGEDIKISNRILSFYKKHASFPDIIIECLSERAKYRKEKYNIEKEIYVINNTIPSTSNLLELDKEEVTNYLPFENNFPIISFAGGCTERGNLDNLILELAEVNCEFNFVAFCYGNDESLIRVEKLCSEKLKKGCYRINKAVSRSMLLSLLKYTDIGVVFYEPNFSINYFYAAPSKFFEYFSIGLKTLSTNNRGINNIIEENGIGECIPDDGSISITVEKLLINKYKSKEETIKLFQQKYCYEKDSLLAIKEINKICNL